MFKKFLRALNQHLEEYLIALFLIAITFVMLLQIVMRYLSTTVGFALALFRTAQRIWRALAGHFKKGEVLSL